MKTLMTKAKNSYASAICTALVFASSGANATGFKAGADNVTVLLNAIKTTIIVGGVVGGLGCIAWGISEMVKKGGDRGDDITWMSVAYKIIGGSMLMALVFVAKLALETLGGGQGNIGGTL